MTVKSWQKEKGGPETSSKRPMTLIELLVVLSIMAAVATIALTGANEMMEQASADETVRRGDLVTASINNENDAASRFVSDMGRLPIVLNSIQSLNLAEIFYSPENIPSTVKWSNSVSFDNSVNNFPETWGTLPGSVTLPCGWRGPYLYINKNAFYDGWGKEWEVTHSDWTTSPKVWSAGTEGAKIFGIRSLGRDNSVDSGGEEWFEKDREFHFSKGAVTSDIVVKIMGRDCSTSPNVFRGIEAIPNWMADTSYSVGDLAHSTSGADLFECVTPGTSGSSEPGWDTTIGNTTNDNTVTWECVPYTNRHYDMDRVRVAIYVPYVTASSRQVKRVLARSDAALELNPDVSGGETQSWTGCCEVRITNLPSGLRKIYVYGYKNIGTANRYGSFVTSVELKPGGNSATVFLTEDLN